MTGSGFAETDRISTKQELIMEEFHERKNP
jgi:hypothetical protein